MNSVSLDVWVVEDDPAYHEMLISYLAVLGVRARGFFSGEECLDHISNKPDVVILDHDLGEGLNGVDVLRKIKDKKLDIPVIYVSGQEQPTLVSEVHSNGCIDYIGKDSASLLRLKLRLEKLMHIKLLRLQKRNNRRLFFALLASVMTILLIVLAYLVFG